MERKTAFSPEEERYLQEAFNKSLKEALDLKGKIDPGAKAVLPGLQPDRPDLRPKLPDRPGLKPQLPDSKPVRSCSCSGCSCPPGGGDICDGGTYVGYAGGYYGAWWG